MAQATRRHGQTSPPRILIADADSVTRTLYTETLRLAGWDVVEAEDGREALTMAFVRVPTLVVTELRLPLLDGPALCEILRRDRTTADVPILAVTGESNRPEIDRARKSGADVVLMKPTTPESLLKEINRLIERVDEGRREQVIGPPSAPAGASRGRHALPLSKAHHRYTTKTPPSLPPALTCPSCDNPLAFVRSHIGGVSNRHVEQWDYFTCATCGSFQFRHRTRKLRRV